MKTISMIPTTLIGIEINFERGRNMVSKIEKEVSKGVDLIKSMIAIFDRNLENSKGLGNVDIQKLMEHRKLIIDSYTIKAIYEVDGLAKLTDDEFGLFVRNLLIEAKKIKTSLVR